MKRQSIKIITVLVGIGAVILLIVYGSPLISSLFPQLNINPVAPLETALPLPVIPTATITQPSPTPTRVAVPLTCGSLAEPLCSVQQAEALAGFHVYAPTDLPDELTFLGAIATTGESSTQVYRCGEVCHLTIYQRLLEQYEDWRDEGDLQGKLIPVGNHMGFYISNSSAAGIGLPTQAGDPTTATQILQWPEHADNITFGLRISVFGSPHENSQLDREGLIELAYNTIGVLFPSGLIAFETNRDGNAEIYARKYYDEKPTNLTNHPAADHSFAWSSDGERISFLSDRTGALEVFIMQPDGSNVLQLTQDSGVRWKGPPAWSPDGTLLALTGAASPSTETGSLIYMVNVDGSSFSLLSDRPVYTDRPLQWSPDGQWIVFSENFIEQSVTGVSGLKAITVDGNRKLILSDPENIIVGGFDWSPDGQTLAYAWMRDPRGNINLTLANADGSEPYNAAASGNSAQLTMGDLAWSPDGTLIAYAFLGEGGGASPPYFAGISLFDFLVKKTSSDLSMPGYTEPSRISWSPASLQIVFAADSREAYPYGIIAALLERIEPDHYWGFVEIPLLEESKINVKDNTNPQWQPRP